MQLTLIKNNVVIPFVLPEKVSGQYWVTHTNNEGLEERLLRIEAINEEWIVRSYKGATLVKQGQKIKDAVLLSEMFHHLVIKESNERALLYVEPLTQDRCQYEKVILPNKGTIIIGRNEDNDIAFSNTYVSGKHAEILIENNQIVIRDLNSSNGTYINGIRTTEKSLVVGDVIYIIGLKIIVGDGFLALNNPDQQVIYNRSLLKKYQRPSIEEVEEDEYDEFEDSTEYFYRSPRFKEEIEEVELTIDGVPNKENYQQLPLPLVVGPALTMGMASLFTAFFTVTNVLKSNGDIMRAMPTIVMSCSMLLGTVMWPLLSKSYDKKRRMEKEQLRHEKYLAYLEEKRQEINALCIRQSEILRKNHIEIQECANRIEMRDRMLWEREIGQKDFLELRLGSGDLPLKATFKYPVKKFTMDDDSLQEKMFELIEEPKVLKNVPITLSLLEQKVAGIIGSEGETISFVKGLILQMMTLHSYDELKLVVLYNSKDQKQWEFVKWLPHVMDEETQMRFIATNHSEVKALGALLEPVFEERKQLSSHLKDELSPIYVVISLDKALANKSDLIQKVLKEKEYLGFSLLSVAMTLNELPKECHQIIELSNGIGKVYDKKNITNRYISFNNDINMTGDMESLAIQLANTKLDQSDAAFNLPSMLTFLELFNVGKVEHLNSLARWHDNDPTISLDTPIGIDTTGEKFHLDLHEKYHGPHGLVAGMTGSGKSEFIISYILSLAVNYHPNEVAFILIDYKGGGMANAFSKLPHLVGTITNLDGAAVKRSLLSIQSELKRRQAIFSQASKELNISNIDIYRYQKLFREGTVSEPLPHLFIISDEFAELKQQQPEFMQQLVSAARIGRSLGIHLILATQKPSGVVDDQIWSNSKFRVCLKVQEKADSNEMIKRPDAADLTNTGRFYLQVGHNELFELGQSSWSGALYYPADKVEKNYDNSIVIIDKMGRKIKQAKLEKRNNLIKNPIKQVDAVLNYLSDIVTEEDIRIKPLWLEPIPAMIYHKDLIEKYKYQPSQSCIEAVIGEYDDPTNQAQHILALPVTTQGNTVIYGVAESGKTTLLTTMLASVIENYTSDQINFYILDFSMGTLKLFETAPHVGDVALSHELEKVTNLFKMLTDEIEERKQLFANYGGDYRAYLEETKQVLPEKVVVIQNYSAFKETDLSWEESLSYLTREGTKYGIYFVVTSTSTQALSYRIRQNFKQTYVLQMNDVYDYSGILGNTNGIIPAEIKGRGLFKSDAIYEFQTAHLGNELMKPLEEVKQICDKAQYENKTYKATKIPILPDKLTVSHCLDYHPRKDANTTPIGLSKDTLKVLDYDFKASPVSLILSEANEHDYFIQGLAEVMSANDEVFVFDSVNSLKSDFVRNYKLAPESNCQVTLESIRQTMVKRHQEIKKAKELNEEIPSYSNIYVIINCFTDLKEKLDAEYKHHLKDMLENANKDYGIFFIIYDTANQSSQFSFESWYKKHVNPLSGIWLGDGIAKQLRFTVNNRTSEFNKSLPERFGFIIKKGKAELAMLVSSDYYNNGDEMCG